MKAMELPKGEVMNIYGFIPNSKLKNLENPEIGTKVPFFSDGYSLILNLLNSDEPGKNYTLYPIIFVWRCLIMITCSCGAAG
jgi:hypothetical protein